MKIITTHGGQVQVIGQGGEVRYVKIDDGTFYDMRHDTYVLTAHVLQHLSIA